MLRTVICDDEPPALELMRAMLAEMDDVDVVGAFLAVKDAIAAINEGGVDLAVFDIEMPDISGVEAFERISVDPKPLLVFATAHPEYALEAFDADAIDYILKPFDRERIARAVEKALRMQRAINASELGDDVSKDAADHSRPGFLRVKDVGRVFFIPHQQVIWVEAAGDYSLIHTEGRDYAVRMAIRTLEQELPADQFVRVHRSTIIAVNRVSEIQPLSKGEARIVLATGEAVKASRSYRAAVRSLSAAN